MILAPQPPFGSSAINMSYNLRLITWLSTETACTNTWWDKSFITLSKFSFRTEAVKPRQGISFTTSENAQAKDLIMKTRTVLAGSLSFVKPTIWPFALVSNFSAVCTSFIMRMHVRSIPLRVWHRICKYSSVDDDGMLLVNLFKKEMDGKLNVSPRIL